MCAQIGKRREGVGGFNILMPVSTLVCFHAHPDDEAIATGGTMAAASARGHRVVLVLATRGELGEKIPGVVPEGWELGRWREGETWASAEVLGCHRLVFLGYRDSGMAGTPTTRHPEAFCQMDVEVAARRLAAVLRSENADVLTTYDPHGVYGHPDHIAVHEVGKRAAELARTPRLFWATADRDFFVERAAVDEALAERVGGEGIEDVTDISFGLPRDEITHRIDVRDFAAAKRAAMRAHASQIGPDSFFLALDDEAFAQAFGWEWFVLAGGRRNGPFATDLFS